MTPYSTCRTELTGGTVSTARRRRPRWRRNSETFSNPLISISYSIKSNLSRYLHIAEIWKGSFIKPIYTERKGKRNCSLILATASCG